MAVLVAGAAALLLASPAAARRAQPMSFLDNGRIRVGVSLVDGGKITYLSLVRGENAHNLVAEVQPSYYGGPSSNPWHVFASGGTVLKSTNDGRTLYTKVLARQEYPEFRQCACTFETWLTLQGPTVHVRTRLTNYRSDPAFYPARPQELPALYSTGDAYRVYTYDGSEPYTGAPVREITEDAGGFFQPGPSFLATEHWAALVNDDGFGLGLFNPNLARFSGIPGTDEGQDYGWVNGYLTTSTAEILDPNVRYTYSYTLIVGTLAEIRGYAVDRSSVQRPIYRFRSDRQHWWEQNASDAGFPLRGALRVRLDAEDPQLIGPEQVWDADDARSIYVRGAWHTRPGLAYLYWRTPGAYFSDDRRVPFVPILDGRFHTYRIALGAAEAYEGKISGLRLDPSERGQPGSYVDIACISADRCRPDRRAERRLARTRPTPAFVDTFEAPAVNPTFWSVDPGAVAATAAQEDGHLAVTFGAGAEPLPGQGFMAAGVTSRCRLAGNYDVQVDYSLLEWPAANGVHVNFGADYTRVIGRQNTPSEVYFAWFPPNGNWLSTGDSAGTLRLVRSGGAVTGYYRRNRAWVFLYAAAATRDPALVQLSVSTSQGEFADQEVKVAFDNFRVNRGTIVGCP